MDFFGILQLIGGLCLFLFGMNLMGQALERRAGGKLQSLLDKMTGSVPAGFLTGLGITAIIQSSSATTVMLVGFVNSGIMSLRQAIPVIMGANIGTTATAWLLSLSGIEGDSFLIQMLKPMSFSPILAAVAIVFMMFMKNEKKYDIGLILIGFAVLMYGMDIMSSAVKPLADVPEFISVLTMFSNPVLGVAAGAVFTAAIQSSSASVGILQALCKTGAVTYGTTIPIIMGQNIGTCVTAILSSIGANRGAKRVAAVCVIRAEIDFHKRNRIVNFLHSEIFVAVFDSDNLFGSVVHFDFLGNVVNPANVAVIHSIFNIGCTLLLLPFTKVLEKLANLVVKDAPEAKIQDETLNLLEERFLATPSFAVTQCKAVATKMANHARDCLFTAMKLMKEFDRDKCDYVYLIEEKIDRYEDALGAYIVRLSRLDISEEDSKTLTMILHNLGDLERITDHARNIAETAEELHRKNLSFSQNAQAEVAVFMDAVKEVVTLAIDAFENDDPITAAEVEPLEDVIDAIHAEVKSRHIRRLKEGTCTIELGFILSDLGTNLERVADHCSNLAVCVIETEKGNFDMHHYLDDLKLYGHDNFDEKMHKYEAKYALPR